MLSLLLRGEADEAADDWLLVPPPPPADSNPLTTWNGVRGGDDVFISPLVISEKKKKTFITQLLRPPLSTVSL